MRKLFLFALILAGCASPTAKRNPAGESAAILLQPVTSKLYQGPFEINSPFAMRAKAQVYLPVQYAEKSDWPLVVLLHGLGGWNEFVNNYFTASARVSSKGFILLIPEGTPMPNGIKSPEGKDVGNPRFWNATDYCCDFGKTGVDDVKYLNGLIEVAKKNYQINSKKIYVIGHSNGGFMANRLACENPEIAGVANLGGGSYANAANCKSPRPISYLQIHAQDDETILYKGSKDYAGGLETVQQWIERDKCTGKPVVGSADFAYRIPGADTKMETWKCSENTQVALWSLRSHKVQGHNPHIPLLHLNFTDSVLDFLFSSSRTPASAESKNCGAGYVQSELDAKAFCIQVARKDKIKAHEASDTCKDQGAKLCTSKQWVAACSAGHISIGGWEWAQTLEQYTSLVGRNSCDDMAFGELEHHAQLRCCK